MLGHPCGAFNFSVGRLDPRNHASPSTARSDLPAHRFAVHILSCSRPYSGSKCSCMAVKMWYVYQLNSTPPRLKWCHTRVSQACTTPLSELLKTLARGGASSSKEIHRCCECTATGIPRQALWRPKMGPGQGISSSEHEMSKDGREARIGVANG